MSSLFGNDEEGKKIYDALAKQVWEDLHVLRKIILEDAKMKPIGGDKKPRGGLRSPDVDKDPIGGV